MKNQGLEIIRATSDVDFMSMVQLVRSNEKWRHAEIHARLFSSTPS